MKDGGAIIFWIFGLLVSLQFIANYIIDPYIKNKEGKPTKYSKIKIVLSIFCFIFFLVYLILDFCGFFNTIAKT